jgi:hypothetical protein
MIAPQNWLDIWKTRAENRRQLLAQALSRKPTNATHASFRDMYVKQWQSRMNNRKDRVEAYLGHVKGMTNILSRPASTGSSSPKGSLGDAG